MVQRAPWQWAGPLLALSLLAGSFASALVGYSMEADYYDDGEKAIAGLLHGYVVFAVIVLLAAVLAVRVYRRLVGSWLWLLLGLAALPLATTVWSYRPVG